jgi:hypothetical protein
MCSACREIENWIKNHDSIYEIAYRSFNSPRMMKCFKDHVKPQLHDFTPRFIPVQSNSRNILDDIIKPSSIKTVRRDVN